MTETGSTLGEGTFGAEVEDFAAALADGQVGGGVTEEPGQMLVTDDGKEVPYAVDTSPRVADVLGQGIGDRPGGEEV